MKLIGENKDVDSELDIDAIQRELISKSMNLFRTFSPSNRNKRLLVDLSAKIFDMTIKYRPQKSSIQASQRQAVPKREEVIADFVSALPPELKEPVMAFARIQYQLETVAIPH